MPICVWDCWYDCASFRIWAAASMRFRSAPAASVSSDLLVTAAESGSLRASVAAARLAFAPAVSR
ncbi:hypothetical protein, partial [Streptomyces sp. NPDC058418]|uniref:hypothetical protein n=1 Tax=Streptomyces sp. NPDC058418 TaxID=3346488 RepID=UPI0036504A42